jgi:oligopeptide transport system substrate-binding protein
LDSRLAPTADVPGGLARDRRQEGMVTGVERTRRFLSFLAIIALTGGLSLASVAAQSATPQASPTAGQLAEIPMVPGAEQAGADPNATLTLNLGNEIDSGDPQVLAFLNEIEISSKVFVPLLALNETNQVAAAAAESMTVSADGKTYTFNIRPGMAYTDGVPVTAANYAYAIKRACSPVVNGNYSNILFDIIGCEEWRSADVEKQKDELPQLEAAVDASIKALDDQTLQIQLKRAAGYFPYVMATWVTYPSRQDLVEAGGDQWWGDPKYYIGNGPFKLVSWTPNQKWVFERNDNYFRGKPGVARLDYREVSSDETALLAYQQGEFDLGAPAASQLPQIEQDPTLSQELHRQVGANTYYISFNNAAKPFDNVKVRQAFAAAMNRDQYIQQINNGVGVAAGTFLYPGIPGYQDETQQTYDPDKAKQLLADAGYPNGEGFPTLQLHYDSESAIAQQRATFWSQNFKQVLNVGVQPTPIELAQLQSMRTNNDPSLLIALENWFEDYPHPQDWLSLVFGPGSTRAPLGWNDQQFYDLVTKADGMPIAEAIPLYQQADARLADQAPVAFYLHDENLVLVKPNVKGYVTYPTSVVDTVYQMEKIYKTAS